MKKSHLFITQCCLLMPVVFSACTGEIDKLETQVSEPALSNSDVVWEGNFFGVFPRISERADQFAKNISSEDEKWLLKNLLHEDRFAICHVILVSYWGWPNNEVDQSLEVWCGLSIELQEAGIPKYKASERESLFHIWTKALADPKSKRKYGGGLLLDTPFKNDDL